MKRALSKKLDTAWSKRIRQYGQCEACNKTKPLHAHHFHGRRCFSVRWDLNNGFCLCAGCHVYSNKFSAHITPAEFTFWAIEQRGQKWYDDLTLKKNTPQKFTDADYDLIYASIWEV
jgi:hypothetical protein|tara:strand:- start:4592 stop:4942 length:351 start_codon:yes stop_codon:yes gene_type:complete